tara:strand:+ start:1489 stop:1869 length:381 start_codon:yes stop_codon:yes gene_type:complete
MDVQKPHLTQREETFRMPRQKVRTLFYFKKSKVPSGFEVIFKSIEKNYYFKIDSEFLITYHSKTNILFDPPQINAKIPFNKKVFVKIKSKIKGPVMIEGNVHYNECNRTTHQCIPMDYPFYFKGQL